MLSTYFYPVLNIMTAIPHIPSWRGRGQSKRDGTRAETRFRLSAKRTSPFKSAGGRQFSRLLAAEVCASAVVILDTPCSEIVLRVLATHSIRQFPLHFPSLASPCAITFQLDSTTNLNLPLSGQLKCDGTRAEIGFSSFGETDESI